MKRAAMELWRGVYGWELLDFIPRTLAWNGRCPPWALPFSFKFRPKLFILQQEEAAGQDHLLGITDKQQWNSSILHGFGPLTPYGLILCQPFQLFCQILVPQQWDLGIRIAQLHPRSTCLKNCWVDHHKCHHQIGSIRLSGGHGDV